MLALYNMMKVFWFIQLVGLLAETNRECICYTGYSDSVFSMFIVC